MVYPMETKRTTLPSGTPSIERRIPILRRPILHTPAGGWRIRSHGLDWAADSPEQLADKLRDFRAENRLEAGEPLAEVERYFADRFPYMAHGVEWGTAGDAPQQTKPQDLTDEVLGWLQDIRKLPEPPKLAAKMVWKKRVPACMDCPQRRHVGPKERNSEALAGEVLLLSRGISEDVGDLGCCALHRHHNTMALLLAEYRGSAAGEQPAVCWVRT